MLGSFAMWFFAGIGAQAATISPRHLLSGQSLRDVADANRSRQPTYVTIKVNSNCIQSASNNHDTLLPQSGFLLSANHPVGLTVFSCRFNYMPPVVSSQRDPPMDMELQQLKSF